MNSKIHILVVDDELGIREGCRRSLTDEDYNVDTAEDGNIGIKKIKEQSFDLMLVDLLMPGIGGLEVIKKVHEHNPEIIIVVITGFATIETAVEATKLGAYDYLPKPFTPEALSAIVKRGLEKRELRLEAQRLLHEREQRLLELTNEKSRLRTIITCMTDGVLVTNLENQLVLWNSSALKMLKLKNTELSGKPLADYVSNAIIVEAIPKIFANDDKKFSKITQEVQIDDLGTVLMANIAPIRDEKGEPLGAVTVLRDITKLKEIEKIKSQFVSMVAHELRSPLAAIEGWLEVIIAGEDGGDEAKRLDWLKRAKERSKSLLALVNDLLEINKIEAGKVALKMESVQIAEVINKTIEFFKPDAEKKHISFINKLSENLPIVQADVKDMEKLFTNLISNAIKYNKENGTITVESAVDENYVSFHVIDTGIGISAENLPRIFEDFFRVEEHKTRKIIGTGLGLTIAKKIVDSHFGHIEVKSEPDNGTTFSVFFPYKHH